MNRATKDFSAELARYQQQIDDNIAFYAEKMRQHTKQQYGEPAYIEADAFLQILERGGKRIRGALTRVGYEMSGGKNIAMITEVARVVEMAHAYFLIVDDIQDKSDVRRGAPSAHKLLEKVHKSKEMAGDSAHFGISVALNSAIAGMHAAQMNLANIDTDEELRLKAISIFNRTLGITAHGQTYDIFSEASTEPNDDFIDKTIELKTAHYTVLNPLHMGMVLAGADCHDTDAITEYALAVGRAFQITDDILGTFSTEQAIGKSPQDDIREGKQTILTSYALKHASAKDADFLRAMLGNSAITNDEFAQCKRILSISGSYDHAKSEAEKHVNRAIDSLEQAAHRWSEDGISFLRELALYLPERGT